MPYAVDTGQELGTLRSQVKLLDEHNEKLRKNDLDLIEAKRLAAQGIENVQKTEAMWSTKMAMGVRNLDLARQEDMERIGRYEKKIADNAKRKEALQEELAALRAGQALAIAAAEAAAAAEGLPALLEKLHLTRYRAALEDEELDVPLLRSMGREVLLQSMDTLGMSTDEALRLADELCPGVEVS